MEQFDRWVKARVAVDSGAADHVMPETMFPRVKRKTFVASNVEHIRDLGEEKILFQKNGAGGGREEFKGA